MFYLFRGRGKVYINALAKNLSLIFLLVGTTPLCFAIDEPKASNVAEAIVDHLDDHDYLGARVLIRKYNGLKFSKDEWALVRSELNSSPHVGWDVMRFWDRLRPTDKKSPWTKLDRMVTKADRLMLRKQFLKAAKIYRRVAKFLRHKSRFHQNRFLYYYVLHSLGRALYGNAQYAEAHKVLSWIPPIYSRFKSVLFERMWAGFRSGKIDQAIGDVISQYSTYFQGVIRPETLLVQIYIYKKLCRDQDLNLVLLRVKKVRKDIIDGKVSFARWAKSDFETLPWILLTQQEEKTSSELFTEQERERERQRLEKVLKKKFEAEKRYYLANLRKVDAYASLAFGVNSRELARVSKLPKHDDVLKNRLEAWPVSDGEDWLDELGYKRFFGQSRCQSKRKQQIKEVL